VILVLSNIRMLPFALFRKERYTLQSLFHMTTLKLKVYYEFYLKKKNDFNFFRYFFIGFHLITPKFEYQNGFHLITPKFEYQNTNL